MHRLNSSLQDHKRQVVGTTSSLALAVGEGLRSCEVHHTKGLDTLWIPRVTSKQMCRVRHPPLSKLIYPSPRGKTVKHCSATITKCCSCVALRRKRARCIPKPKLAGIVTSISEKRQQWSVSAPDSNRTTWSTPTIANMAMP